MTGCALRFMHDCSQKHCAGMQSELHTKTVMLIMLCLLQIQNLQCHCVHPDTFKSAHFVLLVRISLS